MRRLRDGGTTGYPPPRHRAITGTGWCCACQLAGCPSMAFELRTFGGQPGAALLDGCVAVYRAAFGAPPYGEPPERAAGLGDRVARYAARDGFRLPVALEATSGEVAGFGLAVRAYRGDWWRDAVAAAAG